MDKLMVGGIVFHKHNFRLWPVWLLVSVNVLKCILLATACVLVLSYESYLCFKCKNQVRKCRKRL